MRAPLPPRRWRRVVAAVQGVVLTVAAADVLPRPLVQILLLAALALLAESFGRDAWWLWRRRHAVRGQVPEGRAGRSEPGRVRAGIAVACTGLALLIVWAALVAPNHPRRLTLDTFAQLPLELLVVVALAVLLPAAPRRGMAVVVGAVLSTLLLVKVLDLGFYTAFDRPVDLIYDWGYAGIGIETLRDAIGTSRANIAVARRGRGRRRPPRPPGPGPAPRHPGRGRPPRRRRCARSRRSASSGSSSASSARRSRRRARPPSSSARCGPSRSACGTTTSSPARSPATASAPAPATGCSRACAARTSSSCSSRATGGSRSRARPSRPESTPCSTGAPPSCGPPASRRAAPSSPRRPSAASAGWPTPPSRRESGSTAGGATTSSCAATASP